MKRCVVSLDRDIFSPISFLSLILALGLQFLLGVYIWHFCGSINKFPEIKKMNLSLVLPEEESVAATENKIYIKEEYVIEPLLEPVNLELEEILPEDPFEIPVKMEVPVMPKPVEKKITKPKSVVKKVDSSKTLSPKPLEENAKTNEQPISTHPAVVDKNEELINTKSQPVLTKSQVDENSKYLAKVMAVLTKNKIYPSEARRRHIEGKIIVSFAINGKGRAERVKAKTLQPKLLALAAEELIKNSKLPMPPKSWLFDSLVEVPISYKLR